MKNKLKIISALMLLLMQSACFAQGIIFSHSRLVFPAKNNAITLTVQNDGDRSYLVQATVSRQPVMRTTAPFMVTPPLFRLDGNAQHVMRIVKTGEDLPTDRESVFYFEANAIPALTARTMQSPAWLSISMSTIIKVFWRPAGLKMPPDSAPSMMRFIAGSGGVLVKNPTPYYQTFALLRFDGQEQNLDQQPSMIEPFGEIFFPSIRRVNNVKWSVMNDYGGVTDVATSNVK